MYRFTIRDVLWLTVVVGLAVGAGTASQFAQADDPPFDHRNAIQVATATLQKEHYSRRKLDDKLSAEWLAAFVAELDPRRMYFLQSDIADFQPYANLLDDHAQTGDFQFPKLVRSRYRERVAMVTAEAGRLIEADHDFTVGELLPIRYDAYAKTPDELRARWRLRIKGELLIEKVHGRPIAEVQSHLRGRYTRIGQQARDMNDERLCQIFLNSLARLYDADSAYESAIFNTIWERGFVRYYRLALKLRYDDGRFRILGVHSDVRGADALPLTGWELMAIQRTNGMMVDLVEMYPDEAYWIFRSSSGPLKSDTQIRLELLNPVTFQRQSVEWTRFED